MKELILAFLATNLSNVFLVFLAALGVGVFAVLALAFPHLISWLKSLAEKAMGEKIGKRIADALGKIEYLGQTIIEAESTLYRKEILEALRDGKLEEKEIQDIALKMANKLKDMVIPEIETLKKYFVGEAVMDFFVSIIKQRMIKFAQAKLGDGKTTIPFVSTSHPS